MIIKKKKWALALWVWGDDVFDMFVYIYIIEENKINL
jgi:hypothetical protein